MRLNSWKRAFVKEAVFCGTLYMWISVFSVIAGVIQMERFGVYTIISQHPPLLNAVITNYWLLSMATIIMVQILRALFHATYLASNIQWSLHPPIEEDPSGCENV